MSPAESLPVVYYPDPRLRETAKPIPSVTAEIRDLVPRMFEAMYQSRGIGLAGPQIGYGHRIVVAGMPGPEGASPKEEVYLNPVIRKRSGKVREEEGCLSLPGLVANVERAEKVTVEYRTLDWEERRVEVDGLHAKLFQHEIDHLDGILVIDRMTPAERKQWAPLLRELEEDFAAKRRRNRPAESRTAL